MLPYLAALGIALATFLPRPAAAQSTPPDPDPGVKLTRLIDRAEVRVSRLVLQPGAARRAHATTRYSSGRLPGSSRLLPSRAPAWQAGSTLPCRRNRSGP